MKMRIGVYTDVGDDDIVYYYAQLSNDTVMDEHMNAEYCVIGNDDGIMSLLPVNKKPRKLVVDTFYPQNEVDMTNFKFDLKNGGKKVMNGKWVTF